MGRGRKDQRRGSGFSSPRPVGGDRRGRLSRVGIRSSAFDGTPTIQFRHAGRHQDDPRGTGPGTPVGRMVLDRNPDNFFAETEQVAFCTHMSFPESISATIPCCRAGIHSYVDTQINRLGGPNFTQIRSTRPSALFTHFQHDGHMAMETPKGRVFHFREKIFHFDHERIPERVVHARGYGAHGYFENYESLADVTRADLFSAGRRAHAGLRPVLDRGGQQGLGRPGPRRPRLRGEVLHQGGQLGPRRQQHPGVLHPGRDQVPRPDPRRQAGARPRLPAGPDRPRQLLGLRLADARVGRTC